VYVCLHLLTISYTHKKRDCTERAKKKHCISKSNCKCNVKKKNKSV